MIVDAHHHLWRIDQGYSWLDASGLESIRRTFSPADLRAELIANGVDKTVLVEGGRCDVDEAKLLLGYLQEIPEIAGVVAWADPCSPSLGEILRGYRALPGGDRLVGIREQIQGIEDPGYFDRDELRHGLRTIGAQGLAFDLVIRSDQIAAAARLAGELPEVRFVLDHLGKPAIRDGRFGPWAADLALLAACPNVTAKVSGLVTEAAWESWSVDDLRPFVDEALRLFGPDRLMFGSDWPVSTLASAYGKWLETLMLILPVDAREQVLGGTATRTYHLWRD
ncbi:amidohydrolase family protein [Actinoplanes subtropicus]|uniref:amidohydrolase family protein n=1 Tax=Actinoplanes subtropicus TaxID=543632 RepID=UPI0004C3B092|nr:amidohydrolase family protein [Actinoplanes subtropicus]